MTNVAEIERQELKLLRQKINANKHVRWIEEEKAKENPDQARIDLLTRRYTAHALSIDAAEGRLSAQRTVGSLVVVVAQPGVELESSLVGGAVGAPVGPLA